MTMNNRNQTDKPNEPSQTEKKTIIKPTQIKINKKIKNQHNKFQSQRRN